VRERNFKEDNHGRRLRRPRDVSDTDNEKADVRVAVINPWHHLGSRTPGVLLVPQGLADAVAGADVLVDAADSPLFDDEPVMHFFTTTTTNLLSAEREAGVKHHVALSVVGTPSPLIRTLRFTAPR
jgi:hypothetical protein